MKELNNIAWKIIKRRIAQIEKLGEVVISPLPAQIKSPVLYANALLAQLDMIKSRDTTQELRVVPSDLDTQDLDLEL